MPSKSLRTHETAPVRELMAALLLLQPPLDVLSYFARELGLTAATTAARFALLAAVSLGGFLLSDRKARYAAGWGVLGAFWLLHAANCLRRGYAQPVGDAAEYLKLIQFPLWTQAFLAFFRRRDGLDADILAALAVNLAVILGVIALSYAVGMPVYTYEFPERGLFIGVLGWFGVPNAQSALLCLLVPGVLLWALERERLWLLTLCCGAGLGLLYATGTRLAYYTAALTAAAFLAVIVLCRRPPRLAIPLAAALALLLVFRGASPMERRQAVSGESFAVYQEKIDQIMGEDAGYTPAEGEEIPPAVLEKITKVYEDIYGRRGVYREVLLEDLLARFGTQRVMERMGYSVSAQTLNNARARKLAALSLVWEEQDLATHLFGMEYAQATIGARNYDPENDFPDLVYYTGYVGAALYGGFLLWVLGKAVLAFFRAFPALLTPRFLIFGMIFLLGLLAAQLGGQVLRKPNVTVYLSLAGAQLLIQAEHAAGGPPVLPPRRLGKGAAPT